MAEMPFMAHLIELRTRLLRSLIGCAIGFAIAYTFSEQLFVILQRPFNEAYFAVFQTQPKLVITGLVESFMVYLKVGLLGGIFLASPYVFLQVWGFVAPGLHPRERKYVIPFVTLATLFFLGGAAFGYFFVFPVGFKYFLEIAPGNYVQPMIRMQEYWQMASWMLIVFGATFEVPMIVLFLAFLGIIQPRHLTKNWRAIVIGIAVASAVLTPADPGSMLMMMVPMLLLYVATILLSFVIARKRKKEENSVV